jgi:hypothetical protein
VTTHAEVAADGGMTFVASSVRAAQVLVRAAVDTGEDFRARPPDLLRLGPLTPETQAGGRVVVGDQPLVMGFFSAHRGDTPPPTPLKQALRGPDDKIGINFWRWGYPNKHKEPLTVAFVVDKRGNAAKLQVVPTVYVGSDGIVYSQDVAATEQGGPFADLVVVARAGTSRVIAQRTNGQSVELTRDGNIFRARLNAVQNYEAIVITMSGAGQAQPSVWELGCVYRAAKAGAVRYRIDQ